MYDDLINQLTPEQIDAWVQQGNLEPRMHMLDKRLAQANALRGTDTTNHTTGLGGALGAVASVLNGVNSKQQTDKYMGQQGGLLNQSDLAAKSYIDALVKKLKGGGGGGGQSAAGDFNAPSADPSLYG